jgi:hypothetical protein
MTAFVAMGLPQKTSLVSLANRLLLTVNANQFVSVRLVWAHDRILHIRRPG